jgi:hypothetical protein
MAPVIVYADLFDYTASSDTLHIVFSEHIKDVRRVKPFYFRNPVSGITYIANVKQTNLHKNIVHFHVSKIAGINGETVEEMNPGDSIWIKTDIKNNIIDLLGNDQNNPDNVRCLLNIKQKFQGMIIMIKPDNPLRVRPDDRFAGTLSIFDHAGNTVLDNESLGFYNGNGDLDKYALCFAWDGTNNNNNRYVSSGIYCAIFRITHLNRYGEVVSDSNKKAFIGVKN